MQKYQLLLLIILIYSIFFLYFNKKHTQKKKKIPNKLFSCLRLIKLINIYNYCFYKMAFFVFNMMQC